MAEATSYWQGHPISANLTEQEAPSAADGTAREFGVNIWTALLICVSLLGLSAPMARGDDPPHPEIPPGYDLMSLSRAQAQAPPGLESLKNMNDTATVLSVVPSTGGSADGRIEWSGRMEMSGAYKKTIRKYSISR